VNKLSFLNNVGWLNIRWWIWLYFLFSILMGLFIAIYWKREALKKYYYLARFPERIIRVIIHYGTSFYNVYWRLVPDDKIFKINNKVYEYNDEKVLKENEFFADKKDNKKTIIKVDGIEYNFEDLALIKVKGGKYPEIHYFYNNPNPLDFNLTDAELKFSSKQMNDFEENDLFTKLLTLTQERTTMMIVMIICILNSIINFVMLAKMMGWIK
jgi:hypothetical protein